MDYNLFASSYRPQDGSSSTNLNAYGTAGINAGAWRLRSDYQLNKTDSEDNHDQSGGISRTYLFRPLPQLGSKLTLGETDFSSNIFDGFSYTGAALAVTIECYRGSCVATPHKLAVLHRPMPR